MQAVSAWDAAHDRACHALVELVCGDGPAAARERAWQQLLTRIAPRIERWAEASPALRRVGLTGEDEPRAVLVDVIDRLCDRDFANLRRYLAHQAPDPEERAEADMVEGLARLAAGPAGEAAGPPGRDADGEARGRDGDELTGTPLRGWLLLHTRFVIKEHIKQRFGWRSVARWAAAIDGDGDVAALRDALGAIDGVLDVEHDAGAGALAIGYRPARVRATELERLVVAHGFAVRPLPAAPGKRDVTSGAERLDAAPEPSERPPLTTLLGVRQALGEINAAIDGFPAQMQRALRLWLDDTGFAGIAAELGLAGAKEAQALVRAAQARLRERFRGAWPELFG